MFRLSIICVFLIASVFAASINQEVEYSHHGSMKRSLHKKLVNNGSTGANIGIDVGANAKAGIAARGVRTGFGKAAEGVGGGFGSAADGIGGDIGKAESAAEEGFSKAASGAGKGFGSAVKFGGGSIGGGTGSADAGKS